MATAKVTPFGVPAQAPATPQPISQTELVLFLSLRGRLRQLEEQIQAKEAELRARLEDGASVESGDHIARLEKHWRANVPWKGKAIDLAERLGLNGPLAKLKRLLRAEAVEGRRIASGVKPRAILSAAEIAEINKRRKAGETRRAIAADFGIHVDSVTKVTRRERRRQLTGSDQEHVQKRWEDEKTFQRRQWRELKALPGRPSQPKRLKGR